MLPAGYCDLHFDQTIARWDEAIPLGNGDLGCLIWGPPNALRFSIDKGDLWDCTGAPQAGGEYTYRNLIRLVQKKKRREIARIFDRPYDRATPTKLPAGKIIIDLKRGGSVHSSLCLSTAEAAIEAGRTRLASFVSAVRPVGMLRVSSGDCGFQLEAPAYGKAGQRRRWKDRPQKAISQSLQGLRYEPCRSAAYQEGGAEIRYFLQQIPEGQCYGIFLYVLRQKGETVAAYTVGVGAQEEQVIGQSLALLRTAAADGYGAVLKEHAAWWERFWAQSDLRLPDRLLEKNWYLGNYFLGSCSRKGRFPMPLQGVWTADNGELPPWKGDYHHDLNTQLCYSSYCKANHLEEGECFIDYLFRLEGKARRFAASYFEAPGLCLPSVMDIQGNPLGGWPMYSLSPTNQLWLCHLIKKHYDYTGDQAFLQEKAYPYLKECARMIRALLIENENGELVLPLSSSPEIHDNTLKAWLTPNSNYDLALMRCLFSELVGLSKTLGLEEDQRQWESTLAGLAPLAVDTDGCLLLSRTERLRESHRHLSHLMAIHPLGMLRYEKEADKRVIDASIRALEQLGTDYYVGYSFAWRANLYAVQQNGEKARDTLHTFFQYFCSPNGFHLNGDYQDRGYSAMKYRPFSLEGNFCALDAVQEMLLYSEPGVIRLCPAVPADWQDFSFTLRAHGGVLVRAEIKRSRVERVVLTALNPVRVCLSGPGLPQREVSLQKGGVQTIQPD